MLEQKLNDDMKDAMRAGDGARLGTIRMIRGELLKLKKDGSGRTEIPDDEVLRIISTYAKRVKESLDQAIQAGRQDLADPAAAELKLVESYLPTQLGDDDLAALVREAIAVSGATGPKEMGKAMKEATAKAAGRVDGKRLSEAVKRALGA
ncbi:MAG: GatB/YqeY domain-containing protein [Candidatus Eisenbacteria bacterium]|nr:GatB/YqeY domain-containing protein [Candidatus Eisenbacteria bacterium]